MGNCNEDLDLLRHLLRYVLFVDKQSTVSDGELILMIMHIVVKKDEAQAGVRELENRLMRYGVPLSGPLPPTQD